MTLDRVIHDNLSGAYSLRRDVGGLRGTRKSFQTFDLSARRKVDRPRTDSQPSLQSCLAAPYWQAIVHLLSAAD